MMNAARRLKLKDVYNNIYTTDEILGLLKHFEGTGDHAGALSFVCLLLDTTPEKLWSMFEYVEG